jgi:hypothetical protein
MPTPPVPAQLDVDAHGRITPRDDATRRLLADRAGRFLLLPSVTDLLVARRTPVLGAAASPPRCVLAGDLAGFPIVDFVAFVHQSRLSGTLTVSADRAERAITFKDGEVRSARSDAPGERLGEVAIRLGFVTEQQLSATGLDGEELGRALVEAGVLGPSDLWKCVHEQVAAVFQSILLARHGIFFLVDEDPAARAGSSLAVNTQSLLMDGIRRIDEMSLFKARIPGPGTVLRRREPRRPVPLNAGEQLLLAQVDGRRTVAELAAAAHLNEFDATKTLYHLVEAGYAESTGAGLPDASVEAIAEVMVELLQLVSSSVPAGHRGAWSAAVQAFLADPQSIHEPLWQGLGPGDDGAVDRKAFLARLAALPPAVVQRLEPSGDRRALALDALRDLLYFQLFALGGHLPREEDDFLAAEVKRRLATLGGLGE